MTCWLIVRRSPSAHNAHHGMVRRGGCAQHEALKATNERLRAGQLDLDELATGDVAESDLKGSVMKLQAQKTALLDYVQETADAKAALQAQVEKHGQTIESLQQQLTQSQSQLQEAQQQLQEVQGKASQLQHQVTDADAARQAAESKCRELQDAANDAVELRAVQEQLLDNIRELNTRASNAEAELADYRSRAVRTCHRLCRASYMVDADAASTCVCVCCDRPPRSLQRRAFGPRQIPRRLKWRPCHAFSPMPKQPSRRARPW